jgi:hypothetical protein
VVASLSLPLALIEFDVSAFNCYPNKVHNCDYYDCQRKVSKCFCKACCLRDKADANGWKGKQKIQNSVER